MPATWPAAMAPEPTSPPPPRGRHQLETTVSYTAMIREAGHVPGERVLSKGERDPSEPERSLLGLAEGEPLMEVERVRLAVRRPVIYSRDRIPSELLDDLPDTRWTPRCT